MKGKSKDIFAVGLHIGLFFFWNRDYALHTIASVYGFCVLVLVL